MQAEINLRSIEVLEAKSHLRKLSAHLSTALKSVTAKSDLLSRQHALLINTDAKLANTKRNHAAVVSEYETSVTSLKNHITTLAQYVKLIRVRDEKRAEDEALATARETARSKTRETQPATAEIVASNDVARQRLQKPVSIQAHKQALNTVPITKLAAPRPGTHQGSTSPIQATRPVTGQVNEQVSRRVPGKAT